MLKKIISTLLILVGLAAATQAQFTVTGSNPAWEGSTEKYTFAYSGQIPPGLNLQFAVTGGVIQSANTNPYTGVPVSIIVTWNCGATAGSITLSNANPFISFTYPVSILSYYSYPAFCNETTPATQPLTYEQLPNLLTVSNCSPFCFSYYNFQYQWQQADVDYQLLPWQPITWTDIAGATSADYQPPAMQVYGVKAYRRVTSFVDQAGLTIINSNTAFVSFLDFLQPGSLNGGHYITFNTQPVITQNPATGGQCYPVNYIYTWERSVENGPWQIIGPGIDYPVNTPIVGDCRIRRKVQCGPETKYTDPIYFRIIYTSPNAENLNYVRTNTIAIPGIGSWPQADQLPTGDKIQSTTYLDNFGRAIQQVTRQTSLKSPTLNPNDVNSYQDMVSISQVDGLGRSDKSYLPFASASNIGFFKTNALTEQNQFNNTIAGEPASSPYTYGTTLYDGSPLNRVTNTKPPGWEWNTNAQCKGISADFAVYKAVENVRIWNIGFSSGAMPTNGANDVYADGELIKNIVTDDRGKLIVEYKDKSGAAILKKVQEKEIGAGLDMNGYNGWLCTYYVYDDFGRLRYTIPPKAVAEMITAGNWTITPDMKSHLCFYQEYDERGNIIVKLSAGAGEVQSVYDNRNRLVLSQDAVQRGRLQWSFSLYDENDRPVITGLFTDSRNRAAMDAFVKSINTGNKLVQLFTGSNEQFTVYNPVAGTDPASLGNICGSCTLTMVNSASYYDDYGPGSKPFEPVSTADFAPTGNAHLQPLQKTARTNGMATGSKIRVLDALYDDGIITNDAFMSSTVYYNEDGAVLQTLGDNIKQGVDVSSVQYDFAGTVLGTHSKHRSATGVYNNFITVTKADFSLLRQPYKSYILFTANAADIANNSKYKLLSEVKWDALGRVTTKTIGADPNNPGQPIETQDFSYNIQGALTGINKDYATALAAGNPLYDQWSRRFGLYLGYDNRDGRFATNRFDGKITGALWRSQGDNTPRKYDYEYDNIGRFTKANFKQIDGFGPGSSNINFGTAKVDLSASVDGYDANGNILSMKQWGIVPGTTGGLLIDNLQYNYDPGFSRLRSVTELSPNSAIDGKLGDFKDLSANYYDYEYDANGNLRKDRNRNIINGNGLGITNDGIKNNFLNLPQSIQVKGKSKTDYTYDAAGNKLAKKVTMLVAPFTVSTTYFTGSFVYQDNELEYILHPEGKLRVMELVAAWSAPSGTVNYLERRGNLQLTGTKWGVWDYFIKDNLGNTRMVLTEEYYAQRMVCGMENLQGNPANPRPEEMATFGQTGTSLNEVENTEFTTPQGWTSNTSQKVSRLMALPPLNQQTGVGPNVILKVMAGDQLNATAKYYYENHSNTTSQSDNLLQNIVGSLIGAFQNGNVQGLVKENYLQLYNNLNSAGSPLNGFLSGQPAVPNTTPRAYLNYIFFDEQFNYIGTSSGADAVGGLVAPATVKEGIVSLPFNTIAPKNGYVYIYLSNESKSIPVFFDDFNVVHQRGVITEDNAYYPLGLRISGISAKAALLPKAKYGYQGDYSLEDAETGYNEFALRLYDPQIGRWIQADPYDVEPGMYNGMGNDWVNMTDPAGGEPFDWGKMRNADGSFTHQWFEGITSQAEMPEGWIWEGKEVPTFEASNGAYATLHDKGYVSWSNDPSGLFPRSSPDVALPLPSQSVDIADISKPFSEQPLINVQRPLPYINPLLNLPYRPDNMVERDARYWMMRSASMPGNYGGAAMYGIAENIHNFNVARKEGNNFDATVYAGAGIIDFATLVGGRGSSSGVAGVYIPKTPLKQHVVNGVKIPLPDSEAMGFPHTTLGGKMSNTGIYYRQSATFNGSFPLANSKVVPISRVDWYNHGRSDHYNPHQHPFFWNGQKWVQEKGAGYSILKR